MDDREYWQKKLREAEQELEAATRRSDVDAAAKKLQRAKAELKRLEGKRQKQR
jgi:polyhydroxyalkanoate synthesis regulator phasin